MRITINYFEGYPELQADLSAFPLRARAERMRMLASLGLSVLGGVRAINKAPAVTHVQEATPDASQATAPGSPSGIVKRIFDQV
ncbi:MAG: hypothetical protein ABL869_10620 [Candidatus Nitrotoga sp.]